MPLLNLISARVSKDPEDWIAFDAAHTCEVFHFAIEGYRPFNKSSVIIHRVEYGRLTAYDPHRGHRRQILGFPRPHLAFKTQLSVYKFLLCIAQAISEKAALGSRVRRDVVDKGGSSHDAIPHFASDITLPLKFDIEESIRSIDEHRANVLDQLEALQTDPAAFRALITETKDRMGNDLVDSHPTYSSN